METLREIEKLYERAMVFYIVRLWNKCFKHHECWLYYFLYLWTKICLRMTQFLWSSYLAILPVSSFSCIFIQLCSHIKLSLHLFHGRSTHLPVGDLSLAILTTLLSVILLMWLFHSLPVKYPLIYHFYQVFSFLLSNIFCVFKVSDLVLCISIGFISALSWFSF